MVCPYLRTEERLMTFDHRMHDETARVEDKLLEKPAIECLVKAFVQASGASFEGILDPYVSCIL